MNSENNELNNIEVLDFEETTTTEPTPQPEPAPAANPFIKPVESVPVPPKINELGGIPSGDWDKKKKTKKKKSKKGLLIGLVFILIILIGLGLYYFLVYAKNNTTASSVIEDKVVELGEELDEDIKSYTSKENCTLNLEQVDVNKIGTYTYSVTCDGKEYTASIEVKDTVAPELAVKTKNVLVNGTVTPQDFVLASYDLSEITFTFEDEEQLAKDLTTYGVYVVGIQARDESGNTTIANAILIVSNVVATKFLSATKVQTTTYNATLNVIDKIGINSSDYYVNATRIYDYTFNSNEEYEKVKSDYEQTKMINNESGIAIFNDETLNIQLVKAITTQELNTLSGIFPSTFNEINVLYSRLGYANKVELSQ